MDNQILSQFKKWVDESNNIVFFGGAGVSTESGIPDFRGAEGIYSQERHIPPEVILSHRFFYQRTKEFYKFYKKEILHLEAKPNTTHIALAKLEEQGKLNAVITQNIDGLHQIAGSKNVLELHGSIYRNYCVECRKKYDIEYAIQADVPHCTCGGIIRPDVVLYEEPLNREITEQSVRAVSQADMLIVGGTSLSVYPAAGLINYYSGDKLVLINATATSYDKRADLLIHAKLGEVMGVLL